MPDFTKDVKEFTTNDLLDAIYGQIQAVTERGKPDNVVFHYFLPPIPFGPELASFMDLGKQPQRLDNTDEQGEVLFTVNDVRRAAVNFAAIVDYIPTLGTDPIISSEEKEAVDLNSLIADGKRVSSIYRAVLDNCRVVNNSLSEADKQRLDKLRALLYELPPVTATEDSDLDNDEVIDTLLGEDEDDLDLDSLMSEDDTDAGDFVEDPDRLLPPTRLMKVYRALEARYNAVRLETLDRAAEISPNDPSGGERIALLKAQRDSALKRWETQGKKKQVEAVMAKIAVLSRGGMPEYLNDLQNQMDGNKIIASIFASESGLGMVTEDAHYTALRPNGILRAPSLMKVTLESSNAKSFKKSSKSKSSGGLKLPVASLFATAGGGKSSEKLERSFFNEGFTISFEIVQGVIDRPWLDVAFLESSAYTTVDPDTKEPLDKINEIVTLSDGQVPPKDGVMPVIPMTVYFARDIVVRSRAFATMSQDEKKKFSGGGGVSFLGIGVGAKHSRSVTQAEWNQNAASGELVLKGQFMIGMASRFLPKAPNPDFESNPDASDWV